MRKTVDVVNLFVCVVAGAYLAVLPIWTGRALGLQQTLVGGLGIKIVVFIIGAGLVIWNLLVAIQEYRDGSYRRNLEITTEEGTNTVSIRALESQLIGELQKASDVREVRVNLDARGEGVPLICHLTFKLECQDDVMHRVDDLKKSVRETFFRIIPSGIGIEISANVLDLVGKEEKARPVAVASPAEEFAGPKYPVSDSESESV